jgi:hypothetical protein
MPLPALESEDRRSGQILPAVEPAVRRLQAALLEAYAQLGADASAPQQVARRFGITKSQAWKIARLMGATDALEAARYLPGRRGLEQVVEVLSAHGLPEDLARKTRTAVDALFDVVVTHAGDRATFVRTLESLRAEASDPAALESSRKLSFLGNSGTWGIQARAQVSVRMVVPNADEPEFMDIANVAGLLDLRRLRFKGRWPLAQHSTTRTQDESGRPVPLEGGAGDVPFLAGFCSDALPTIQEVDVGNGMRYDLCEGPVGKAAALSCVFGVRYSRFAPIHASMANGQAIHGTLLRTPAEAAVFDLLIHRSLPFELPPTVRLESQMESGALTTDPTAHLELPLAEPVERLGSGPPHMGTVHHARHAELVEHVAGLMDCTLDDFSAFRVVLKYPPIPTMLCLQHPLIER